MKVLMNANPWSLQTKLMGGAGIQFLKTFEYVKKARIDVHKFDMHTHKFEDFDILHNFEMGRDTYRLMSVAKDAGLKIAVSSVYWPPVSVLKSDNKAKDFGKLLFEKLGNLVTSDYNPFFISYPYKGFLQKADIIFPNSQMEAETIAKRFAIPLEKFHVVPNGVDKKFYKADPKAFIKKYKMKDFVLFVGRIEPRKNILRLIQAVKKLKYQTVIIGPVADQHRDYYDACVKEAKGADIHFLGKMEANSPLLMSAYAAAKTFVLPSWFETPGLVALEAGLAGCTIAIGEGGSTKEYFKEHASYCKAEDLDSIIAAFKEAHEKKKGNALREHIKNNFTWDVVAQRTIEGYRKILPNTN